MNTKICPKCKVEKPLLEFYKRRKRGFSWPCKQCENQSSKEHYELTGSRDRATYARQWRLNRYFGITIEQYEDLLKKQDGKCFICQKPPNGRHLAVDHDHHTGEIRGLLCTFCNRQVIGRLRDPDLLQRAVDYLRQGTGLFVPKHFQKGKRRVKRKRKKNS